jgi:molybdopterin synthase catalytic subunit
VAETGRREAEARLLGVYAFEAEEVGAALELLPLAARRALDRAGLHLSLEGWRTLSLESRRALIAAGAQAEVDTALVRARAAECSLTARSIEPVPELDAAMPGSELEASLGGDAARVVAAWPALHPLSRFALAHLATRAAERGDRTRLAAALGELFPADPGARGTGRVREEPLSSDEAVRAVSHDGAGAVDLFLGVVRDMNDGRAVSLLEYEAYASMAEAELGRIEAEVEARFVGVRAFASHRVGALRVGDVAVICAASAVHRAEAFAACRLLIDEIKARLPIWKREHGPDGPYWVGWQDARCVAHDHAARPSGEHGEHTH